MTSPFNWKGKPSIFKGTEFNGGRERISKAATAAVDRGTVVGAINGLSPKSDKRLKELGYRQPMIMKKPT